MSLDWKSPESENRKRDLIGSDWDTNVHTYLWYEIGNVISLTPSEISEISEKCFVSKPTFGDIELHRSAQIPGNPVLLRLRGELRLKPSIVLRGRYCPLYQVGHGGMPSLQPGADCLVFLGL